MTCGFHHRCGPPSSFTQPLPHIFFSFPGHQGPTFSHFQSIFGTRGLYFQEATPVKDMPALSSACWVKAVFLTLVFEGHSLCDQSCSACHSGDSLRGRDSSWNLLPQAFHMCPSSPQPASPLLCICTLICPRILLHSST